MSLSSFMRRLTRAKQLIKTDDTNFQATIHRIGMTIRNNIILRIKASGLKRRTGALANSIQYKIETMPTVAVVKVGSYGVRYAAIHEFGGIIRPKRAGGALTIPLKKRYEGMMPSQHRNRFRPWYNEETGKAGLYDKHNNEYAFVFKRSVKIKERRYLRDGFEKSTKSVSRILRQYFREVFKK